MISHTVLFRLKRPVSEPDRARLLDGLRSFAAEPPHAAGPAVMHEALGLRGESPRAADVLLGVRFADADAFQAYIEDERHQALVRDVLEPTCEGWWSVQAET